MSLVFDMKDLGKLGSFLGVSFTTHANGGWLSQSRYVDQILKRFGIEGCKAVATPACITRKSVLGHSPEVNPPEYQEIVGPCCSCPL